MLERDEAGSPRSALVRVPVLARKLETGFDGFGSAVAEERTRHSGERREPRGQLTLQRVEIEVRRVQQLARLRRDRFGEPGIGMSE